MTNSIPTITMVEHTFPVHCLPFVSHLISLITL